MRKRRVSVLALAIAGLITICIYAIFRMVTNMSMASTSNMSSTIDLPQNDTAFGGIFYTPQFNDSLPHYLYRRMEDSAKAANTERELENRSVNVSGLSIGVFGVYFMDRPKAQTSKERLIRELLFKLDTAQTAADRKIAAITNKDSIEMINNQLQIRLANYKRIYEKLIKRAEGFKEKYYYVGLDGYKLDRESKFFIDNETFNLAYVKWDASQKNSYGTLKHGHYERKEIPVRYSAENERVLVPVSYHQFGALRSLLYVVIFVFLVILLYFFIGIPVQVLLNISRGQAFDENNVRYFNLMARAFLVVGLLSLFMPYILHLFLHNIVPDDFKRVSFKEGIWNTCWIFLLSIAVFIIGKAFQKGNTLQKEQDLTI